jgi:hypothetical protein
MIKGWSLLFRVRPGATHWSATFDRIDPFVSILRVASRESSRKTAGFNASALQTSEKTGG